MGKSNVNPDHYKIAGRERQGEDIVQEAHRQKYAEEQAKLRRKTAKNESDLLPGAAKRRSAKKKRSKIHTAR
jgi:hypothetical protein